MSATFGTGFFAEEGRRIEFLVAFDFSEVPPVAHIKLSDPVAGEVTLIPTMDRVGLAQFAVAIISAQRKWNELTAAGM